MKLSVEKAKQIREDIGATHLILFAHAADGEQNVSTHGETEEQAHQAADFGNELKRLMGWPENLCQSTPAQRAEWQRKTATAITSDVNRVLAAVVANQREQEKLFDARLGKPLDERQHLEQEHARLQRLNEDYRIRLHTLEWVLRATAAPGDDLHVGALTIDRTQLGTAAAYAAIVDSLTQYGGGTRSTAHDFGMPADGIFRVWTEHYDPDATPDPAITYTADGDDQTNNVRVELAFAVDFGRGKLLLADAEYDLVVAESEWTDAECWSIEGDGFSDALALHRFTEKHHPAYQVGVCFLAEWA